jgi:protein-L-isoaspartate(D-aspartate) O-methyltransferase
MTSARTRDRLIARLREEGISDQRVLDRIRDVPRHLFVDEALSTRAYEDTALPIGFGQTISQPFIVALMTQAVLADGVPERVLEIGTGCGYQTAVLAGLCPHVYSVERLGELQRRAGERLREIGTFNVTLRHADGWRGFKRHAPYDAIIVTAAPDRIPQALLDQLASGGRLVLPVDAERSQELLRIRRDEQGEYSRELLAPVSFVPMLTGVDE